ncbi:hypothetical protein HYT02_00260 [Candidatus Gottesmanbacteria bacterium]|nr:hypothetical protein [Candidatus Gottesmanbacteria bacterium]
MKQEMVVSNIRIPKNDWLQVKAVAGELGMSVNQYINYIIERFTIINELSKESTAKRKSPSIWDLPKTSKQIKTKPLGLSREDKEIYGL